MLEEEVVLLESTEGSQIAGSKCKEIASRDEEGQQPFKKAKGRQQGKYCKSTVVKMEGANLCERCVSIRQNCLVHYSR